MILHRAVSAIFGLVLALSGLVAAGYIPTNFKGYTLLSGAVGILVPGVLMLSAFYMAVRFLRFAVTGKKQKSIEIKLPPGASIELLFNG